MNNDFNAIIEDWYFKYRDRLYNYLINKLKDKHIAEDIIQNAFISAWKNFDKFNKDKKFYCWLITIVKRRVADHYRKEKIKYVDLDANSDLNFYCDPEIYEFSDEISSSLKEINKDLVNAFMLIKVYDYTHKEAAEKLNVPIGTVLSRVDRARKQLREKLINKI